MTWIDAIGADALANKRKAVIRRDGVQVLLLHTPSGVFAVANRCPHEGYPLSEGMLGDGCVLTCNWHNWKFDLESGKTLQDALVAGELAATIGVQIAHPDVAPLIPDAAEAGFRALAREGHYPINHLLVVKDSVLKSHPHLAEQLFEAFTAAKRPYLERLGAGAAGASTLAEPTKADRMYRRVFDITGRDPLPYGIEPNRPMVAALIRYAREQRIISRQYEVEELFTRGNS